MYVDLHKYTFLNTAHTHTHTAVITGSIHHWQAYSLAHLQAHPQDMHTNKILEAYSEAAKLEKTLLPTHTARLQRPVGDKLPGGVRKAGPEGKTA